MEEQQDIRLGIRGDGMKCSILNVSNLYGIDSRMSYTPMLVSIGPYHHGAEHLKPMEAHKSRYLEGLLGRVNLTMEYLEREVASMEAEVRDCYWSEFSSIDSQNFIKMLIMDGCFLLEHMRRIVGAIREYNEVGDPLLYMECICSMMFRDVILLDNQIPFCILERLYNLTTPSDSRDKSLSELFYSRYRNLIQNPRQVLEGGNIKHLLDWIRLSIIPNICDEKMPENKFENIKPVERVQSLRRAGIRLCNGGRNKSPLDIKFCKRWWGLKADLIMPTLNLDDFTLPMYRNCMLMEQVNLMGTRHISAYLFFITSLIGSEEELDYVCKKGIIVNGFDTNAKVIGLLHELMGDIAVSYGRSYLTSLQKEVNDYCSKGRFHIALGMLKYTYFRTGWAIVSVTAATILLILTIISTIFTVLTFVHDVNKAR